MEGFVTIHRKILDWEWYSDANVMRVFIHCLLRANYQERSWQGNIIGRGQLVTSVSKLSQELGLTPRQISGALDKLKRTNEIAIKTSNKNTTITICKYDDYQTIGVDECKTKGKTKGQTNVKQNGNQTENKGEQINNENNNNNITNKQIDKNTTPKGDSTKKAAFDFRYELIETYQVPDYVVDTWLEIRRKKKANNSKLALDALVREAGKAGISVAEAVRKAAENSWQSFQACYIKDRAGYNRNNPLPTSASFDEAERSRLEAEIKKQQAEVAKAQAERERQEWEQSERERIKHLNELTGFDYQPENFDYYERRND